MNENQAKVLLKKSALKTTELFTDSLMEKIEAKAVSQELFIFPSIKKVFFTIAVIVLLLSFLIFSTDFILPSVLDFIGNINRTKLFGVVLFSVLLGVNHVLKIQHASKALFNHP